MSTQQAFLAAIRETPEDDAPRLIYADWLEDNGDPERAEFIRVQCELARLREDEVRAYDLRWRQDALLAQHGKTWREEVPAWARRNCTFRRGFVNGVRADTTEFIQCGSELSRTVPVREVSLNAEFASVAALASCPHLATLTTLAFEHPCDEPRGITDAGAAALSRSEHLSHLKRLGLVACQITNAGARAIASSKRLLALEELNLARNRIGGAGATALLDRCPRLVSLRLYNAPWTSDLDGKGLRRLFSSSGMSRLECLSVDTLHLITSALTALLNSRPVRLRKLRLERGRIEAQSLADWRGLANLEELAFYEASLEGAGVPALVASPHLARLRRLEFRRASIGDSGVAALARSPHLAGLKTLCLVSDTSEAGILALSASPTLMQLIDLEMQHSYPTPPVMSRLAAAPCLTGLRRLSLSHNGLEEGIEYFCESLRMEQLAILELNENEIDDDGATALAECAALSNLRVLDLERNNIGDTGATALARSPILAPLQQLNLRHNRIGNAGLQAIASSPYLANIVSLNLGENYVVRSATVKAALKERFGNRVVL